MKSYVTHLMRYVHSRSGQRNVRNQTGCSIIALKTESTLEINPDPGSLLAADAEIILIGVVEDQTRFLKIYA